MKNKGVPVVGLEPTHPHGYKILRRESFPLRTTNKNAAASKAARIYGDVCALGWDAAILKHKPESVKVAKAATVGALIEAAKRHSPARDVSLEAYAQALRRITIGTLEMKERSTPKTRKKSKQDQVENQLENQPRNQGESTPTSHRRVQKEPSAGRKQQRSSHREQVTGPSRADTKHSIRMPKRIGHQPRNTKRIRGQVC